MRFVARLLSVLAIIGLLAIPVSTVVAETAMAAETMAMVDMGDMPCCPDEQPVKPDCGKDCPLVIICTTSTAMHFSKSDWTPIGRTWSSLDYRLGASATLDSLAEEPPARPPKV